MFNSRDFCRTLKVAVASLSLLAGASFSAAGQTATDIVPHSSPTEVTAGGELNKGVEAYKSARYDEAISHFQRATELDPSSLMAKSYLATALAQNVAPGLDTPENLKTAQRAIDIFEEVLAKDRHDVNSMKQIAGIDFSIKKLEDAKVWQKKVLDEDPKDSEAAYTVGVIDWMEAHQNVLQALLPAGFTDDGMGNANAPAEAMKAIMAQNGALVKEGLEYLNQAVVNRPNYDDAMAYLNLMYRRKADLDWSNEAARKDDIAEAEQWRAKAMETRKTNEEKKIAGPNSAQP
jgi:tetratricopeptide (TPR) repeat protein